MNVKILEIRIGGTRAGILFQYAPEGAPAINRFVADRVFMEQRDPPTVSLSYLAATPDDQSLLWRDYRAPHFNGRLSKDGRSWLLPAFFQNLLPEGIFREQIAQLRHCAVDDHFELLAACGKDLPGNIYALPVQLDRETLGFYVTQDADALEMTVTADPLDEGVSLSGVQPKLGVLESEGRYVGRSKDQDSHIIAKLPVVAYPLLPEVEALSLQLARAAGANVCDAYLEPMGKLMAPHRYDLDAEGNDSRFLAVPRYDRRPGMRIHCEDFAQVFGVMPEDKYSSRHSCLGVAAVFLAYPSLGEAAVHELLRRLVINEMLGNPDMHLKNIGLWYPDGRTPRLPPAYDIVAYSAYMPAAGHGLRILPAQAEENLKPAKGMGSRRKLTLSPAVLRAFCNELGIPERPAAATINHTVAAAHAHWPALIEESLLSDAQKRKLLAHFMAHARVAAQAKRAARLGDAQKPC